MRAYQMTPKTVERAHFVLLHVALASLMQRASAVLRRVRGSSVPLVGCRAQELVLSHDKESGLEAIRFDPELLELLLNNA
jgi:hypothetical protein